MLRVVILGAALLFPVPAAAAFDPAPWLDDLQQVRAAFSAKYANWDWATAVRQANMSALFGDVEAHLRTARNLADAERAFDWLVLRLGDGHVEFQWSGEGGVSDAQAPPPRDAHALCEQLGYSTSQVGANVAAEIPGFAPLSNGHASEFPAGVVPVGKRIVGIVRIGEFSPQIAPLLCEQTVAELHVALSKPCDDACSDQIEMAVYTHLSRDLEDRLRELRDRGASVLIVDVTRNGGGSEWAEAAARIVTSKPVYSERVGFVRDEHWVEKWGDLARELRAAAPAASPTDRARLEEWSKQADAAAAQAATHCSADPFWRGQPPSSCSWLGKASFATGLVQEADPSEFQGKSWGPLIFSPAGFQFERGAWQGPTVVLVDGETWSAAEEFAAALQDSSAAVIAGAPSGGAGCGHTGDPPTKLVHIGAVLELPDCVRFRRDGTNEVNGIKPDVLIGFRPRDGVNRRALRLAVKLRKILAAAEALQIR